MTYRHPFQIGRITATVEETPATGAWVKEEWFELDRQENSEHEQAWHGPFDNVDEAQAYADVLVRSAGR